MVIQVSTKPSDEFPEWLALCFRSLARAQYTPELRQKLGDILLTAFANAAEEALADAKRQVVTQIYAELANYQLERHDERTQRIAKRAYKLATRGYMSTDLLRLAEKTVVKMLSKDIFKRAVRGVISKELTKAVHKAVDSERIQTMVEELHVK